MKDLQDRMKKRYEDRTRYKLPRRTYTIMRLDGKCFSTFTERFDKPFDQTFMNSMDETALYLLNNIQGSEFCYTQSDEISILLTDFLKEGTEAWFDGNIQKMCSVSASFASTRFSNLVGDAAHFDSRVFTIPDPVEVENYFIWRQLDSLRNSVLSLGQEYFSHNTLHGKSCEEIKEMLQEQENIVWSEKLSDRERLGGMSFFKEERKHIEEIDEIVCKTVSFMGSAPNFIDRRDVLKPLIPRIEDSFRDGSNG